MKSHIDIDLDVLFVAIRKLWHKESDWQVNKKEEGRWRDKDEVASMIFALL